MANNIDYVALGERIRKLRQDANMTQDDLSEVCELSTAFIGHIERGTRKASLETIFIISKVLKVKIDYLLSDSYDPDDILLANVTEILKSNSNIKLNTLTSTLRALLEKLEEM